MRERKTIEAVILDPRLEALGGLPVRATAGAAAIDLVSCEEGEVVIQPQGTHLFRLGFAIHIHDPSVAGWILPRSGLGSRDGLVLANTVGLIDSDYTGELKVMALNRQSPYGGRQITVKPGERIFQMVFVPVVLADLMRVDAFSRASERGAGGFGSTGS